MCKSSPYHHSDRGKEINGYQAFCAKVDFKGGSYNIESFYAKSVDEFSSIVCVQNKNDICWLSATYLDNMINNLGTTELSPFLNADM